MYQENRGNSFAPVRVGDELDVQIEAVGEKGDGIAKKKGFVLFIPNTREGDQVKVRITKVFKKVGFAEVIGQGSAPAEEESNENNQQTAEPVEDTQEDLIPEGENSENFGEEETVEAEHEGETTETPTEEPRPEAEPTTEQPVEEPKSEGETPAEEPSESILPEETPEQVTEEQSMDAPPNMEEAKPEVEPTAEQPVEETKPEGEAPAEEENSEEKKEENSEESQ